MSILNHKLQEKGLVYCTTPNFNSLLRYFEKDRFQMIVYPNHISFYTKDSIRYLGKNNNFKSLKVKTTGLDIGRLINFFKLNKNEGKDERITYIPNTITANVRKIVEINHVLSFVKVVINYFLSIFGKGDTLKVFWVKK